MSERRLLAIVGFLLILLGGVLVLVQGIRPTRGTVDLTFLVERAALVILATAAVLASILVVRGPSSTGGFVALVLGVVILVINGYALGGVLCIIGGVVGILAREASPR